MSDKFCSIQDAKVYMREASGWTEDDDLIEAQIVAATELLKQFTRRSWVKGQYVDYFSTHDIDVAIRQGRDYAAFTLREKNLSDADGEKPVVKFHTGGNWDNAEVLQTTNYSLDTRLSRIIFYPQKMRSYGRSLQVTYTAGFARDDTDNDLVLVPSNVKTACAIQAAFSAQRVLNATAGASSKNNKTGATTYAMKASGLIAEAHALIRSEPRLLTGSHA